MQKKKGEIYYLCVDSFDSSAHHSENEFLFKSWLRILNALLNGMNDCRRQSYMSELANTQQKWKKDNPFLVFFCCFVLFCLYFFIGFYFEFERACVRSSFCDIWHLWTVNSKTVWATSKLSPVLVFWFTFAI